ncbi:MAG: hypothetical protein MI923_09955 [Phycisphaerales bacterium]|nr:hypothetical protein [Phycisphaerales bacterium]
MLKVRLYRWRKRILLPLATLPLFQMTGTCDPFALQSTIISQTGLATFNLFVSSIQQTLLTTFPSADILQILLGGNRQPFFTG